MPYHTTPPPERPDARTPAAKRRRTELAQARAEKLAEAAAVRAANEVKKQSEFEAMLATLVPTALHKYSTNFGREEETALVYEGKAKDGAPDGRLFFFKAGSRRKK